jgi:hypothetical protein
LKLKTYNYNITSHEVRGGEKVLFEIDSMYLNAKRIYKYATTNYGYNLFIIDELDGALLGKLRLAILQEDKLTAIKLSREVENQMDKIRDFYCYNHLPYKSNFRCIAKDIVLFLKHSWLRYNDDFKHLYKILRFISTSDYYIIREYLMRTSYSLHYLKGVGVDPETFPSGYYSIEFILAYTISCLRLYFKE